MLMMLNLLPLPPLDGGRILVSLIAGLPGPLAWQVERIEPYGFFMLVALLYFCILSMILWPLIGAFINLVTVIFSLPPQIFSII